MSSYVLTVGDEILAGRIHDTNATWLSTELRRWGFPVRGRISVGDDVDAIAIALKRALEEAKIVIVTGGLGPTADDLTRFGVAKAFGVPVTRHADAVVFLSDLFEARGRTLTEANLVQADLPAAATLLRNTKGTAPGFVMTRDDRSAFVIPGVPSEMRAMFDVEVTKHLAAHPARGPAPVLREVTTVGIPESALGEALRDVMARGRNPTVGSYPQVSHVVLALEATGPAAEALLDADVAVIRERLGEAFLGEGQLDLADVVARSLRDRGVTLAVAESLTGGLVADRLVAVPGVSQVFLGAMTAYANAAKVELLGVPRACLERHGAVSEECAVAMAQGVRSRFGADVGLSTTGIAGPEGGTPGKPVGTVCLALASATGVHSRRLQVVGDRPQIRIRSAHAALDLLRRWLQGRV